MTNLAQMRYEPQYGRGVMLPMTIPSASEVHRASRAVEPLRWYVINTYPNAEFEVYTSLGSFRRYLPTILSFRGVGSIRSELGRDQAHNARCEAVPHHSRQHASVAGARGLR